MLAPAPWAIGARAAGTTLTDVIVEPPTLMSTLNTNRANAAMPKSLYSNFSANEPDAPPGILQAAALLGIDGQ